MPDREPTLHGLFSRATSQENPIAALRHFLDAQRRIEQARDPNGLNTQWRFVGYVLDLSYDTARIITSDPYKMAVGGIPRGSFLIMTPADLLTRADTSHMPPHFTLLRVTGVSTTPLSSQVQQTYFELHKRAMPELDVWTQGELQWGALDCDVLGMFYAHPADARRLAYSGDVNNVVSAHRYEVFAPDRPLLEMIVNGTVGSDMVADIGALRPTECQFGAIADEVPIPVRVSMRDFAGRRTAMFGKTRLGKSNVVKLLAQAMLDRTPADAMAGDDPASPVTVGQLIFDVNGEYANDNEQDGSTSIRSANHSRCDVYALTPREAADRPLRLNFYEQPDSGIQVLASLLQTDKRTSIYVTSFSSVSLPSTSSIAELAIEERDRPVRKIQFYWAILKKAGFDYDPKRLKNLDLAGPNAKNSDPGFSGKLRQAAYDYSGLPLALAPGNLSDLVAECEVIGKFAIDSPKHASLKSTGSGNPILDSDDLALLKFLTHSGAGPDMLRRYRDYHAPDAGDFVAETLDLLDRGRTVILDLGHATESIRRYFADLLSRAVFAHQEGKFVGNHLGRHFVQLYFEEAHNLFPINDKDLTGPYARFAKEGAKFHIGMVYSTQSPSTINRDLLAQTENFFVGHLSSIDEAKALTKSQGAFAGIEADILRARTPGYMRMLTQAHRFVVPIQANKYEAGIKAAASTTGGRPDTTRRG